MSSNWILFAGSLPAAMERPTFDFKSTLRPNVASTNLSILSRTKILPIVTKNRCWLSKLQSACHVT